MCFLEGFYCVHEKPDYHNDFKTNLVSMSYQIVDECGTYGRKNSCQKLIPPPLLQVSGVACRLSCNVVLTKE